MKINPDVFFIVQDRKLVAWNYRAHEQFEISRAHLDALINPADEQTSEAAELAEAGLLKADSADRRWDWDVLSRIFHIGTSAESTEAFDVDPEEEAKRYVEYCTSIADDMPDDAFSYRRGVQTQLPVVRTVSTPADLVGILERRRTNRTFTGEPLPLSQVLEVLSQTFRYRDHDQDLYRAHGLSTPTRRRSSPSAGSLQSCEAYLIARRIEGLDPGIYHYWSDSDCLGHLSPLPKEFSIGKMNAGQMFSADLSASVVVTCRFEKLAWKYPHSRAYRVALLDAGHLSQTFQLVATALGMRTWLTGMFFDFDIRRLLGLDEDSQEFPILSLGLGTGEYCPFDKNMVTV